MMRKRAEEIRYFLYSQAFADGLRITFAILMPALAGFRYGWFAAGLSVALGALCVSLTDAPGPLQNKRNGMLICSAVIFVVSILTSLVRTDPVLLCLFIALISFFFSMFTAYGPRATAVGTAAILVMILTIDDDVNGKNLLQHSILILAGAIWYLVISILFNRLQPFRPAQRILGECIREISKYLSIKAAFYDPHQQLSESYKKLLTQQIIVNEKQDAVREILFKTRQIVNESTKEGRRLVMTFVETVDLFEDITASYYNYENLRERFANSGILEKISDVIIVIAKELDRTGIAIQLNSKYHIAHDLEETLVTLKAEIDALPKHTNESQLVLKKILVNLRRLVQKTNALNNFSGAKTESRKDRVDHTKFISHQPLDAKIFFSNLSFESSVFRHSLRVAIAMALGYIITKLISYGEYSYWVLLTIAFILKPAFSLTRERNIQRIIGTVAGGLIGIAILLVVHNRDILFGIMVLFMLLNYSFMRTNYLAMVFFTTPFVIILFHFMGVGFAELTRERIFDTVLGGFIAFAAGNFLFPTWEKDFIRTYTLQMIEANKEYLRLIVKGLNGEKPSIMEYKLVRKEVYVATANLSAAFQRMLSEPKGKQQHGKKLQQFIVLNHVLSSNIATVATGIMQKEAKKHPHQLLQIVNKAIDVLKTNGETGNPSVTYQNPLPEVISSEDVLLKDQLEFIAGICQDISKNVSVMNQ